MIRLPLLDPDAPEHFPNPARARAEPNGLLAFGGDLSPARLLAAYSSGIFPWFGEGEPILWWSPDPRCVFHTQSLHPNRSLRRQLAGKHWRVTMDQAFEPVVRGCAAPRDDHGSTWIVPDMIDACVRLHQLGHAHSVEVWESERLVGGIYGVAVGKLFCGESMFSIESGGSKAALMALGHLLRELDCPLLDTQVANPHTLQLGAVEIPRAEYLQKIAGLIAVPGRIGSWSDLAAPSLTQLCAGS
ncbi:leucyl/phenylalanyl-tRNA--protein transferase [Rhodanobacter sp. AS-Z3]|uniref:leucyl/phenylalanyl-tRNA--protein transferase n=1 Tax=Rhodanobacter sp. AS-Z3 TaxID=3031330 RepID=UPI00247ACBBC|nr:leucyl/phenylalanyl-tRNA--protein transferase [Rhodanobacter sp. AS-Z3]WEN13919.1 leucyl/phenylalanyl-tRNA--protein transferase [Rhodanobacter sp. AS-Z3]